MTSRLGKAMAMVAAVGAVVIAVACSGCSKTVTQARPRPCADWAVAFGSRIGLYTGHVVRYLAFTNRSGQACTLAGYPAIAAVTSPGGSQVGAAASRGPGRARQVVLAPGGRAWATLVMSNWQDFGTACSPRQAWGLRVYPPGQRVARYLPFAGRVCSGPVHMFMWVGPVRRAA